MTIKKKVTLRRQACAMVIRRRLRAILFPLALFTVSCAVASYFVWHAINGERGMKAKEDYLAQMEVLNAERIALTKENMALERRIAMMRRESVDRELLEEEARVVLGRVHRNDVVIFEGKGNW